MAGGRGRGGSLISGSLQYFVISDVWDLCFPDTTDRFLEIFMFNFWVQGTLRIFVFKAPYSPLSCQP